MRDAKGRVMSRTAGLFFTAVFTASAVALAAATVATRLFQAMDCVACSYHLAPYAIAAVVAGATLLKGPGPAGYRTWAVVCALSFAAGCALVLIREGIQDGWWSMAGLCDDLAPSLPESRPVTLILGRPLAALCEINENVAGDSTFATLNFIYSATMAFVCAVAAAVDDFDTADR